MNGDGVSGEGVDGENIELLWRLVFERKPRVAQDDVHFGGSFAQVSEGSLGDRHDLWIDLVKAEDVAGLAVGGERAGAQPDYAGALRPSAAETKSKTHARVRPVVRGRLKAPGRIRVLRAVLDAAVQKTDILFSCTLRVVFHTQGAVEVAGHQDGILLKGAHVQNDDRSEERRVGKECRSRWSPYH